MPRSWRRLSRWVWTLRGLEQGCLKAEVRPDLAGWADQSRAGQTNTGRGFGLGADLLPLIGLGLTDGQLERRWEHGLLAIPADDAGIDRLLNRVG